MKKQIFRGNAWLVIFSVLTAVGVFGLLSRWIGWCWQLSRLFVLPTGAASVGIIGGADGPTAIFVTTSHHGIPWYGFLILALIGIVGIFWCCKKQNDE